MYELLKDIREILISDSYVNNLVGGRVSTQHISGLQGVTYPTITICRIGGSADPWIKGMDDATVVVDIWSKKGEAELWEIYDRKVNSLYKGVRNLLHRKSFSETNLQGNLLYETNCAVIYDIWSETYHLSANYRCMVIRK